MALYSKRNGVWQETPFLTAYGLTSYNFKAYDTEYRTYRHKSIWGHSYAKAGGVWHETSSFTENDIAKAIFYIYPTWVVDERYKDWRDSDDVSVMPNRNEVIFRFYLVNHNGRNDTTYMAGRSILLLFEDRFGELWSLDMYHSYRTYWNHFFDEAEGKIITDTQAYYHIGQKKLLERIGRPIRVGRFGLGIWVNFRRHYIYSGGGYSSWFERLFFQTGSNSAQYEDYTHDFDLASSTASQSANMRWLEHMMIAGKTDSHDTNFRCELTIRNIMINGRHNIPAEFVDLGEFRDHTPSY